MTAPSSRIISTRWCRSSRSTWDIRPSRSGRNTLSANSKEMPGPKEVPMFANREDGARQLALKLKPLQLRDPLVLAIPRGGIVTGAILARELGAELDVVLSRKL